MWGDSPLVPGAPQLLIYGHYDVQPVDPLDEWVSPPFEPNRSRRPSSMLGAPSTTRARSTACSRRTKRSCQEGKRPPINVHFLIEGEEECGGHVIGELLRAEPDRAEADAMLVCDMSYYAPRAGPQSIPRFAASATPNLKCARPSATSTPATTAAPHRMRSRPSAGWSAISRTVTGRSRCRIAIAVSIRRRKTNCRAGNRCRSTKTHFLRDEVTGRAPDGAGRSHSVFERTWALPTFELHGIRGGFAGEGAKTVIPALAIAKISMRLVPGLSYEFAREQLTAACERVAPVVRRLGAALHPRRRPGAGRREASRVRASRSRPSRRSSGARPSRSAPAVRFRWSAISRAAARRCCSPASGFPMTGCTHPTRSSICSSSGTGSRCSGDSFELMAKTEATDER